MIEDLDFGKVPVWTRGADGEPIVDGDVVFKTGYVEDTCFAIAKEGIDGSISWFLKDLDGGEEPISLEELQSSYCSSKCESPIFLCRDAMFEPVAYLNVYGIDMPDELNGADPAFVAGQLMCMDLVMRSLDFAKDMMRPEGGDEAQFVDDDPSDAMKKNMAYVVRSGEFEGEEAVYDGTVSEILGWSDQSDIYCDGRPVALEYINRCSHEGQDLAFLEDLPMLGYFHIGPYAHIVHMEQIDWGSCHEFDPNKQ